MAVTLLPTFLFMLLGFVAVIRDYERVKTSFFEQSRNENVSATDYLKSRITKEVVHQKSMRPRPILRRRNSKMAQAKLEPFVLNMNVLSNKVQGTIQFLCRQLNGSTPFPLARGVFVSDGKENVLVQENLPEQCRAYVAKLRELRHENGELRFRTPKGDVEVQWGRYTNSSVGVDLYFGVATSYGSRGRQWWLHFVGTLVVFMLGGFAMAGTAFLVYTLRKSRFEAEQKVVFVANVSHELKTPLTSILGYAEMLEAGMCRTEEKRQRALKIIADNSRCLNRRVRDVMEFCRQGTTHCRREAFELGGVVRETVEGMAPQFSKGLVLEPCEEVEAVGDSDKVKEILENLLTNAQKYAMADGPVEVSIERGEERVCVRVSDHGPGMSESQRKRAFEPFWRADNAITKLTGGYGIGLSLAYNYAVGMGGDLTVSARKGGGCVFTLTLPLKIKNEEKKNG